MKDEALHTLMVQVAIELCAADFPHVWRCRRAPREWWETLSTDNAWLNIHRDGQRLEIRADHPSEMERAYNPPSITVSATRTTQAIARDIMQRLAQDARAHFHKCHEATQTAKAGLSQASQPAPAVGAFSEMMIDNIIMTYDDKGKPAYKATGTPYNKFGVRVWDEVLPTLGIDPIALKPGPNPQAQPIRARVLMNEPEEGKTTQPRKVTGKV